MSHTKLPDIDIQLSNEYVSELTLSIPASELSAVIQNCYPAEHRFRLAQELFSPKDRRDGLDMELLLQELETISPRKLAELRAALDSPRFATQRQATTNDQP
jgi:hypothetical protein